MEILSSEIYEKKVRPVKVLQFGEGNFLRAFIDWFFQKFNDEADFNGGIVVVQPLPQGRISELSQQNGLYTLVLEGIQNDELKKEKQVIDVLEDFVNPYTDYSSFLNYAKNPELKMIVSNTTEAGIILNENDIEDTVVSDSYPGKLLSFLKFRYDFFDGDPDKGFFIVPCELIDFNGSKLKDILNQLSHLRHYSDSFIHWLNTANLYYNTLVDRIVPGYPADNITKLEKENGYKDHNIVKGELFHLWVVEGDKKIRQFIPIDSVHLNIVLTDNVKPYKERKVKILNGAHTCMVPIAYQYGIDTVGQMMETKPLCSFLEQFLQQEVWPTLKLPQSEKETFTKDVMERFKNPTIHHKLLTISLNSMSKYKTRVLPSAIEYYNITHNLPKHCLFSLSALFVMFSLKNEDGTSLIQDNPEFINFWHTEWKKQDISTIAEDALSLKHWEYDFSTMKGSKECVINYIQDIQSIGIIEALQKNFNL